MDLSWMSGCDGLWARVRAGEPDLLIVTGSWKLLGSVTGVFDPV
jgi:hypothetical protein